MRTSPDGASHAISLALAQSMRTCLLVHVLAARALARHLACARSVEAILLASACARCSRRRALAVLHYSRLETAFPGTWLLLVLVAVAVPVLQWAQPPLRTATHCSTQLDGDLCSTARHTWPGLGGMCSWDREEVCL